MKINYLSFSLFRHESSRAHKRGVALIITMSLVLLLSGLILAFFSQSTYDRKISDSSSKLNLVDLFAQGAVQTIFGDIRQEIAAGSNVQKISEKSVVYFPKDNLKSVPSISGFEMQNGLENLLKISSESAPRGSGVSTDTPSINGRAIQPFQWNKHLLLKKQDDSSDGDLTPTDSFKSPDWIYVDRIGENPGSGGEVASFGKTGKTTNNSKVDNTSYVVGRYAYAIYHEGGLLDANVAGYPMGVPEISKIQSNKYNATFADLSALPGFKDLSGGRQNEVINQLVGWRNYASTKPTGNLPLFGFSSYSSDKVVDYLRDVVLNPSGFLYTSNKSLFTNQSDSQFTSRSQLIQFFTQGVAQNQSERARIQDGLRFLGTFSRSLEQPSYVHPIHDPAISNFPRVVASYGGNSAVGRDDKINPSFLDVRVTRPFFRRDGTPSVIGEPLVKKRFPLRNLAWITYKGPSAILDSSDPLIKALIENYGYSEDFLKRGTAENVYRYFGISWVKDTRTNPVGDNQEKWVYNHSAPGPYTTLPGSTSIQEINNLSDRDPDFFELLKASIAVGSKAKAATRPTTVRSVTTEYKTPTYHYRKDTSLDLAMIQIGANMIDQSDLDAFSTRILFHQETGINPNGGTFPTYPQEVRGVENLPYLHKVRLGLVQGRSPTVGAGLAPALATQLRVTDTGYNVLYLQPEVWNPHDSNCPVTDPHATTLKPTYYRCVAYSASPESIEFNPTKDYVIDNSTDSATGTYGLLLAVGRTHCTTGYYNAASGGGGASNYVTPDGAHSSTPVSAPFTSVSGTSPGAFVSSRSQAGNFDGAFRLSPANAALYFQVPSTTKEVFREPTLLVNPDLLPSGVNLTAIPPIGATSTSMLNPSASVAAGIPGAPNSNSHPNIKSYLDPRGALTSAIDGRKYLGFYLNTIPANWNLDPARTPATGSSSALVDASGRTKAPNPATGFVAPNVGTAIAFKLNRTGLNAFNDCSSNAISPYTGAPGIGSSYVQPLLVYFTNLNTNSLDFTATYRMQYYDSNTGKWVTYDEKFSPLSQPDRYNWNASILNFTGAGTQSRNSQDGAIGPSFSCSYDPRTSRFGVPYWMNMEGSFTPTKPTYPMDSSISLGTNAAFGTYASPNYWIDTANQTIMRSFRSDATDGQWFGPDMTSNTPQTNPESNSSPFGDDLDGWKVFSGTGYLRRCYPGYLIKNDTTGKTYYKDPDGLVRRAMGAYNSSGTIGLPTAQALTSATEASKEMQNRPIVLNRPFKTVGELGAVFSGTPWKNIDFFTSESGDTGLLDVFSIQEPDDHEGMVAGKVNLNTRQVPVLKAILLGTYHDVEKQYDTPPSWAVTDLSDENAERIAQALVNRTTGSQQNQGPLMNVSELVGKFRSGSNGSFNGFADDLTSIYGTNTEVSNIQRLREASIRALSGSGQTRVWNLMIDVIAQVGKIPPTSTSLKQFYVEGEQHYWVHLAIDRWTGEILDKNIETVR